ncbi:DUF2599 domain-containing protein [Nocardia sp. alder85J]|uniref:DUF2599 domain-containing protein n=1 Tax=Nocardia sp. alder85J TaxID=2862949 RepID=UPI0022574675|nr:DUF2599 domain-containing protein [Nocardia sp. alder85J]MCX4091677.1 DUF2599 domain-containing protein [Nocardia sp. alder85J]
MALLLVAVAASGCGAADESAPVAVGPAPAATSPAPVPPQPVSMAAPIAGGPAGDRFAGQPLIDHTEWTQDPDGSRLHVYPTAAGRTDWVPTALDRAWGEVLTMAPDADTPGMYDQFTCHWQWARLAAPSKPSWNLEPWRPAVGYEATVAASCNPGGPDPAGN